MVWHIRILALRNSKTVRKGLCMKAHPGWHWSRGQLSYHQNVTFRQRKQKYSKRLLARLPTINHSPYTWDMVAASSNSHYESNSARWAFPMEYFLPLMPRGGAQQMHPDLGSLQWGCYEVGRFSSNQQPKQSTEYHLTLPMLRLLSSKATDASKPW